MFAPNLQRILENLTLYRIGIIYLLLYTHVNFFPKTRYRAHTGRMRLAHRFLYILRIRVDYQRGAFTTTTDGPPLFKHMGMRKTIHYPVFVCDRYALRIGIQCSMILVICKDYSLADTCCTTCIQDIGNIIETRLLV